MTRRSLLGMALMPAVSFAFQRPGKLRVTAVEFTNYQGKRETLAGVDGQFQVNPLHIYDEMRPKPYADSPNPRPREARVSALYLKISTDGGVFGFYGPIDKEAAIIVDQQIKSFLIGKDPLAGEALWDQMFRSNRHSRRGTYLMGISAVDNTLWDLRGRYFGVPVFRLLGGPTRPKVEAYASALGFSLVPASIQKHCLELKKQGFRYQKWFLGYGPGSGAAGMNQNVELVRILRESLGPDSEIMFDAYQGWSLDYAIAWAKRVEQFRPRWIEEAFPADKREVFAQLRKSISFPVASGEHFYGRWEVQDYLQAGAVSVVQADPEWCGGISELLKICNIASLYDAMVIPHGHSIHAALHVVASQSPAVCPLVENLVTKMRSYHHFEKSPPTLDGAHFPLPEKPGFGIEIDESKVEKKIVATWA